MLFVPPSIPYMVPEAEAQSDTTQPVVTVYQSTMTNSTSNPAGKIIEFTAFVSDNVGVTSGPTCIPASGSLFPVGTTTVTCIATDAAGNVGTGTFTVTVTLEPSTPLITPSISVSAFLNSTSSTGRTFTVDPGNWGDEVVAASPALPGIDWGVVYRITDPNGVSMEDSIGRTGGLLYPSASDGSFGRVSAEIPLSWEAGTYTIASMSFRNGANWNTDPVVVGPYSTTVIVPALPTADTTPPTDWYTSTQLPITNSTSNPAGKIMQFSGYGFASFETGFWVALQTDCSPSSLSFFPIGITTVTCTATDAAGNVGTGTFTVTITLEGTTDTTPPVVTVYQSTMTNSTSNPAGKIIEFTAFVSDNVGVTSGPTCIPASGSLFPVGTTTVTCIATDAAGNPGTGSFTITVILFDTTLSPPYIPSAQTYVTSNATEIGMGGASYYYPPIQRPPGIITNLVDICSPQTGSFFTFGTTTVTCTGTDAAGNVATGSFTVTVILEGAVDTTPTTMTASAYLNSTSSTGRTLNVVTDNLESGSYAKFLVKKDGTKVAPFEEPFASMGHYWIIFQNDGSRNLHIEIPNDWVAGTYNLIWVLEGASFGDPPCPSEMFDCVSSSTFTVPALPEEGAEEEIVIPSWIKNNAGWWANGQIDDRSFVSGLQWLISNGIMNIPPTEQGAGSDDVIPGWIKNNAGWWADDLIDDRNFVTGLQWLITNGIMIIG